jgi:hypothetical protein
MQSLNGQSELKEVPIYFLLSTHSKAPDDAESARRCLFGPYGMAVRSKSTVMLFVSGPLLKLDAEIEIVEGTRAMLETCT